MPGHKRRRALVLCDFGMKVNREDVVCDVLPASRQHVAGCMLLWCESPLKFLVVSE